MYRTNTFDQRACLTHVQDKHILPKCIPFYLPVIIKHIVLWFGQESCVNDTCDNRPRRTSSYQTSLQHGCRGMIELFIIMTAVIHVCCSLAAVKTPFKTRCCRRNAPHEKNIVRNVFFVLQWGYFNHFIPLLCTYAHFI